MNHILDTSITLGTSCLSHQRWAIEWHPSLSLCRIKGCKFQSFLLVAVPLPQNCDLARAPTRTFRIPILQIRVLSGILALFNFITIPKSPILLQKLQHFSFSKRISFPQMVCSHGVRLLHWAARRSFSDSKDSVHLSLTLLDPLSEFFFGNAFFFHFFSRELWFICAIFFFQVYQKVLQRGYRALNSGFCKPSTVIGSYAPSGIC